MFSSVVDSISSLLGYEEEDDPSCLKDAAMMAVYGNPHKQLGVSTNAEPWEVRDAFRTNCIRLLSQQYFNKMDKPLLPYKYSLAAFHLIMETIPVKKAQHLKKILEVDPNLTAGEAKDVLHVLRPLKCDGIPMNPAVRACGMLHAFFIETNYSGPDERDYVMPHQKYVLTIFYCGRTHVIRKRYREFEEMNELMSVELLMVPGFPPKNALFKVGFGNTVQRGRYLCEFVNRVHSSLAARGVFSPRLLDFLGIDAARVHIEEEGRVSKLLDSTGAQQGSVWHMVEETWLKRWRKFVLGRGARRYEPPGPITNELLLLPRENVPSLLADDAATADGVNDADDITASSLHKAANVEDDRATSVPVPTTRIARQYAPTHREIKALGEKENRHIYLPPMPENSSTTLTRSRDASKTTVKLPLGTGLAISTTEQREPMRIALHYRAVNYNLWAYWKMVHGGGPCISRKHKDILSPPACGTGMEAVSRIQRFGRMVLAKLERLDRYWRHLSRTAPGVREVLADYEKLRLENRANSAIATSKAMRTASRLQLAARYTQRSWRAKRQYAFNDDNVRVQKHAQEVFATADGEVERAAPGAPFVVEEGESIVKLGVVERFDVKFTDADGPTLPITLKKHSCSELTFVQHVDPNWQKSSKARSRELLEPDCVLLVVQNYPLTSLDHNHAMGRLESSKWPVTLRFERPLHKKDVKSFYEVCQASELPDGLDDELKLQLVKRLLHRGLPLQKYGRRNFPHETVLYLNETIIFWEINNAKKLKKETPTLSRKYDLTKSLPLYDLKYVRIDKVSSVFNTPYARRADPDRCFSLFAENRTLDFEVLEIDGYDPSPDDDPEHLRRLQAVGRRILAWAFDAIAKEVRGSKVFVDKAGAPITRSKAKKRLRVIR